MLNCVQCHERPATVQCTDGRLLCGPCWEALPREPDPAERERVQVTPQQRREALYPPTPARLRDWCLDTRRAYQEGPEASVKVLGALVRHGWECMRRLAQQLGQEYQVLVHYPPEPEPATDIPEAVRQLDDIVDWCFAQESEIAKQLPAARHSPDFRSVHWFGTLYEFSPIQATCIGVLWQAWEQGTPDVGDATILEAADSINNRLAMVFRKHPAWKRMIKPGRTKGTHRLSEPTS